jgi:hypothetical protein
MFSQSEVRESGLEGLMALWVRRVLI